MARTEAHAALVEMGEADVSDGLGLSEEAGWNQTAEDWSLLIRLGRAFAVPGSDGRLVATALALPYPPDFGWVSMVLVHGPYRRRGLATRLLERAITELRDRGVVPFLDATPTGRDVYARMGFRPLETLVRWRGRGGGHPAPTLPPILPDALPAIAELDHVAFGADRSPVLADLLGRPGAVSRHDPEAGGFLLSRAGRTATHVGPVVARETRTALGLLEAGLAAVAGPVVIDVPERASEVASLLSARGFEAERPFARMALGRDVAFGDPVLVRAVAGPELG
jgi:GNAT superfamily N-acetyltransferase